MPPSPRPRNRRGSAPPRPEHTRSSVDRRRRARLVGAGLPAPGTRAAALVRSPLGLRQRRSIASRATPAPGDVVSLVDHDGRFIGRGFYNPRSQIPVRLCTRADEPVDAAFFRARIAARARRCARGSACPPHGDQRLPPDQQRGRRSARAGGRRLRRRGGRADHHAGDRAAHARRSSTRSRPSSACATIFESSPAATPSSRGSSPRRGWRAGESRATRAGGRGRHRARGRAALRAEDRHVHRPARDAHARRARWRAARACSTATPTRAASRLQAARGGAASVTAVDSSARAVARIEAHAAANGVRDRRGRGRRLPLPRDRHAARRSIWWSSIRRSSRARARTSRPRARATSG